MTAEPLLSAPELEELINRTRTIGSDSSLVVFGGGNTSAKGVIKIHDGSDRRVMWIKASGGDMATATASTFTPLDLDIIDGLRVHDDLTDEEMVNLVAKASLMPGAARPSIETLLHGFLPSKHIDHVHADAICALTNHPKGREATLDALGSDWAYVEWLRSGFPLSKVVERLGDYRGVVLAHHGVITWAETSEKCLAETLEVVSQAENYLTARAKSKTPTLQASKPDLQMVIPRIRAGMSAGSHVITSIDSRFLDIANRPDIRQIVSAGVSSADHMLRIGALSMVADDLTPLGIDSAFSAYGEEYGRYTQKNIQHLPEGYVVFSGVPRVVLVPGVGAVTAGKSTAEAAMVAEIAMHTHQVAARVIDCFGKGEAISDEETFRFEYWPMELYKLSLKPQPLPFAGKIVIITGAASGIGRSIATHLASLGASLVLADIDQQNLQELSDELSGTYGVDSAIHIGDQSDVAAVHDTIQKAILTFGGLDGVVLNAGIAVTGPLADLPQEDWERVIRVNLSSAFLLTQASINTMTQQGLGGSLVFMGSKNAFAPGKDFGAYSVTKAGLIQLMRIAAIEGGPSGIRSNALNPDAVFDNSELWAGGVREARAAKHGVSPDDLEAFYAQRNILHLQVRGQDVAKAAEFLLSESSSRTTGAVIPVDGGVDGAFPR